MSEIRIRGVEITVADAAEAAALKISEIQQDALFAVEKEIPARSPYMACLAVLALATNNTYGSMTPARAASILSAVEPIMSDCGVAEDTIASILDDNGLSESEKIEAIQRVSLANPTGDE